jgi:excisionase family DNA binding protein
VRFFVARLRERRGGQVTEKKTTRRAKVLPSPEEVRAKETLSPEEMAVVLGCGRTMAYRILANSEILSFTIGRLRRVRRADVERYMAERVGAKLRDEVHAGDTRRLAT